MNNRYYKKIILISLCVVLIGFLSGYIENWFVDKYGDNYEIKNNDGVLQKDKIDLKVEKKQEKVSEFTIAFTGDLLIHDSVFNAAQTNEGWDFDPMFKYVFPLLSEVDVAICHLETPLSPDNTNLRGYPNFNVPNQMADAIKTQDMIVVLWHPIILQIQV